MLKYGQATAAFIDNQMACVATTLAFTKNYCELGVATLPEFRGKGLALECFRALIYAQFESFGRLPCWRTNTANVGSWKTARNLGLKETPGNEEYLFLSNYRQLGLRHGSAVERQNIVTHDKNFSFLPFCSVF